MLIAAQLYPQSAAAYHLRLLATVLCADSLVFGSHLSQASDLMSLDAPRLPIAKQCRHCEYFQRDVSDYLALLLA
jgi:hypothetical protein